MTLGTLSFSAPRPEVYSSLTNYERESGLDEPQRTLGYESVDGEQAMALKVELRPHERIIVGNCVITNTDQRARLLIDGDNVPILRERDILTPETADTPAKLVYLAVQLMYISPDPQTQHGTYFNLVRDIVTAVPSSWPIIEAINNNILNGDLYRALKDARKLIAYEEKLRDQYAATHPKAEADKADVSSAA
jgi:flagellar biosynthesis repressor protein FlbT